MEHSFLVPRRKAFAILVGTIAASVVALAPHTEVRAAVPATSYGIVKVIPVGDDPTDIAFTPNGAFAYVTNALSDNVSVINTATGTVSATIPVGDSPASIAINPAGTRAYVTNQIGNNVTVIDIATNTTTSTIPVGALPVSIAINPAGTLAYVTNAGSNNVTVIDIATNTTTSAIPVGASPQDVAINPSGTRAYVTNYSGGTISVINTSTSAVVHTTNPARSSNLLGIAINASGEAVTIEQSGLINRFDLDTYAFPQGTGGTSFYRVAAAGGGSSLFYGITSAGSLASYDYDAPGFGLVTPMGTVGAIATSVAVQPNGEFPIYVTNVSVTSNVDTVTVIDKLTPTITPQTGAAGTAVTVTVTPSNIAYDIDDNAVTNVKFGGVAASTITPGAGNTWTVTAPAGSGAAAVVVTFGWLQQPGYLALGYRQASAGTFTYPGGSSGGESSTAIVFLYHVSLDPGGGVCVVNGEPTTMSTRTPFLGYSYIPSAEQCARTGFTFQGWAATTKPGTVLSLPLLRSWDDGIWRYFIADNHDLIAVWKPTG